MLSWAICMLFDLINCFGTKLDHPPFQALVEFFGTLSKEWALECMKDLLMVNLRGNLQIIVQVIVLPPCSNVFVGSVVRSL